MGLLSSHWTLLVLSMKDNTGFLLIWYGMVLYYKMPAMGKDGWVCQLGCFILVISLQQFAFKKNVLPNIVSILMWIFLNKYFLCVVLPTVHIFASSFYLMCIFACYFHKYSHCYVLFPIIYELLPTFLLIGELHWKIQKRVIFKGYILDHILF